MLEEGVEGPVVMVARFRDSGGRWGLVVRESGCSCSGYGDVCALKDDECVCSVCVGAGAAGEASDVVGVAGESKEEAGLACDRWVCVR